MKQKMKLFTLISFLFCTHINVFCHPLIIINNTTSTISFHVSLKSGNQTIEMAHRDKWKHDMSYDRFVSLTWKDYSEINSTWSYYKISVKEQIPSFYKNGGTLVISKDGSFLYDEKKGNVKNGKADKINFV